MNIKNKQPKSYWREILKETTAVISMELQPIQKPEIHQSSPKNIALKKDMAQGRYFLDEYVNIDTDIIGVDLNKDYSDSFLQTHKRSKS